MSETSPSDLAVAFRSLDRRLREALEPVGGDRQVAAADIARLDDVILTAERVVGQHGGPEALAAELADRPADAWRNGELEQLRHLALRAGQLLRSIAEIAERHAEGG
jgi:hypothetical protein